MDLNELAGLLDRMTAERDLELEWADLLSQLEYVGCRKILKAVRFDAVTLDVLRHAAEEASHALLLKSAAEKNGLPARSWKDGLLGAAGWRYFQALDRGVEELAGGPELCYPLVSVAVERRVLALYPAYLERTRIDDVRKAVARILAQEKRHARQFEDRGLAPDLVRDACTLEERLWSAFTAEAIRLAGTRAPAR
jgi:hypothetical protein